MVLVFWVGDGFHNLLVAPGAAHILWRAGPSSLDADWKLLPPLGPPDALEQTLVPPVIPEVVLVPEPELLAGLRQDVAQLRGGRVLVLHFLKVLLHQHRVAVKSLPDPEVVQVAVRPAHRRLNVF